MAEYLYRLLFILKYCKILAIFPCAVGQIPAASLFYTQ